MVGKFARFLAPIALAAVAVGVYLMVHSTLLVPPRSTPTRTTSVIANTRRHGTRPRHRAPTFYRVKTGDTLSQISAKTGVSVARLTSLNPAIANSPNSLQAGQRLRLRGSG
jgi:LysM repeat protein